MRSLVCCAWILCVSVDSRHIGFIRRDTPDLRCVEVLIGYLLMVVCEVRTGVIVHWSEILGRPFFA